jgi:hypothetical protein
LPSIDTLGGSLRRELGAFPWSFFAGLPFRLFKLAETKVKINPELELKAVIKLP